MTVWTWLLSCVGAFHQVLREPFEPTEARGRRVSGSSPVRLDGPVLVVALAVTLSAVGCDRGINSAQDAAPTGFRADTTTVAEDGRACVDVVLTVGPRDGADYEVVAVVEQRRTGRGP
ncbi:MAG: hypothetical protein EA388_03475 [Nitriliruptor sp.]|nr:MAG: hypothetical protein EA388_03475 [Nitriliruptor sp.]